MITTTYILNLFKNRYVGTVCKADYLNVFKESLLHVFVYVLPI